jgi:TonB-linked SusC/RagA family outer membrane protein
MKKAIALFWICCSLLLPRYLAHAQNKIVIKGVVRDAESNERMIGVSIMGGTPPKAIGVTDANGTFSVSVEPGTTLTFRFIGYSDNKIKLTGKNDIAIRMRVNENKLNETVVIGYQKKTREVVTGSAIIVSGKDLQDIPVSNVEQLLQGKVPGLNIQNNTGAPGFRGSVFIRGISSIGVSGSGNDAFLTPTSPLYVIDGVPIDATTNFEYGFQSAGPSVSPLSLIPPEDVESMEILKDAQATSLYGSRGAYGVILITTKRGNSPIPLVRYTGNFFMNTPPKLRPTIGGKLERDIRLASIYAGGRIPDIYRISNTPFLADSLNPYYNNSTNWQDIFYRTTYNQTHNVSISGGDPTFNYKANLGYYHENGVIRNTGFDRYSLGMNMEYKPSKRLRVFGTMNAGLGQKSKGAGNGLTQAGVAENGKTSSLLPAPSFFLSSSSILASLNTKNDNKAANLRTSLDATFEIVKGLSAASSVSYEYASNTEDNFTPAAANKDFSRVYAYSDRNYTLYNRNSLSYFHSLNEKHNFFLSVFNEIYSKGFQANVVRQEKTPSDQFQGPLGFDAYYSRGGGVLDNYSNGRIASFAGTFSYDYKKKYILDVSYRMDGSSTSGFEDPYAKNPSVGLRWNFSKENALADKHWLTYGSVRTSWGRNIVPTGDLFSIYGQYNINGTYNNIQRIGLDFGQLPNPYLKPSTTTQYNFGFEAGFFDSRIEVIFDTYYKDVSNLLKSKPLPDISGFDNFNSNEVSLINYGYELMLTFRPLSKKSALQWTLSLNAAINKDVLTRLPDAENQFTYYDSGTNQWILFRKGRNSFTNYIFNNKGAFSTNEDVPLDPATGRYLSTAWGVPYQAGDPYYEDVDGDYVTTDRDRRPVGNSMPQITGGFSSYLSYKNFSLNINGSFTILRDILNNALAERMQFLGDPYNPKSMIVYNDLNYWKQSGDVAKFPNLFDYYRTGQVAPFRFDQTTFQESGTYYKLNTISLSYNIDRKFVKQFGMNSVRLYLSGNNLLMFTKYSGPNPENVTDLGKDRSDGYPVPRTYNFGLNVEF